MSSLLLLLQESTQNPDIITIEATVTTGFEFVAMEECRTKLGKTTNPKVDRGRIFFNIPTCNIHDVDSLRSIDNLYIVIKKETDLNLTDSDLEKSVTILKALVKPEEVYKAVDVWSIKNGFTGIIYPNSEQYTVARDAENKLKSSARTAAEERFAAETHECSISNGEKNLQYTDKEKRTKVNAYLMDAYREIDTRPPEEKLLKFRVTCVRNGKHSFQSEIAAYHVGGTLQDLTNWVVDLQLYDAEFILNIRDDSVYYGIALTKESKHHRNITEFGPTTLRATICFCMLWLAKPQSSDIIIDPMCGGGSIPIEGVAAFPHSFHVCGDIHEKAVSRTEINIQHFNPSARKSYIDVFFWNAAHLPLKDSSVDIFVTDLPFGKRSGSVYDNRVLYKEVLVELARVVRCKTGRAVLLTHDKKSIRLALLYTAALWKLKTRIKVNMGGLQAGIFLLTRTDKGTELLQSSPKGKKAKRIRKNQ